MSRVLVTTPDGLLGFSETIRGPGVASGSSCPSDSRLVHLPLLPHASCSGLDGLPLQRNLIEPGLPRSDKREAKGDDGGAFDDVSPLLPRLAQRVMNRVSHLRSASDIPRIAI